MSKVFLIVFVIFGTVVGSGFSSGKEIMIFFSRFGVLSYLYILLAGFGFFWLFYFFLTYGQKVLKKVENSKTLNWIIFLISLVFCASMFAGMKSLFYYFQPWLSFVLVAGLIVLCFVVTLKGLKALEKVNAILMPATSIIFLTVLIYGIFVSSDIFIQTNSWAGFLYSPLYVALNSSMSGLVIAKFSGTLNKKQTFLTCLFSTLLLTAFLLFGNFVLQRNTESFISEMPFLYIVRDNAFMFVLAYIVILVGCFTTLISLTMTIKSSFQKCFKSEMVASFFAVFVPFLISALGFSDIVTFLYPLCSVLGILLLIYFVFDVIFNKNVDKIIFGSKNSGRKIFKKIIKK